MRYIIITLCLFGFVSTASAEFIRLEFSVAIELPLTPAQEVKLTNLKAIMADLQADFKNVSGSENTTKTHICRHDVGGACIEEKELADTNFTKINPISTPKPK